VALANFGLNIFGSGGVKYEELLGGLLSYNASGISYSTFVLGAHISGEHTLWPIDRESLAGPLGLVKYPRFSAMLFCLYGRVAWAARGQRQRRMT